MIHVSRVDDVAHIACTTARDFLSVLSPVGGVFQQSTKNGVFAFRGVSSDAHNLLPAAFRSKVRLLTSDSPGPRPTIGDQCSAELQTVRRFFDLAAQHGVRLPEDSQLLRHRLDEWEDILHRSNTTPVTWPPLEFYSLIALAQHHGIPTRALDWTWNSLAAAYFAACRATQSRRDHISVWTFYEPARLIDHALVDSFPGERPIVVFTAPGADNPNLSAQRGLFTMWAQNINDRSEPFLPITYDQLMIKTLLAVRGMPVVMRVTAPVRQANSVLAMLAAAGVTAGALFPGLWGVARQFWEEQDFPLHDLDLPDFRQSVTLFEKVLALFETQTGA